MEVLNWYLKVLPILKISPKAVATTRMGNVPFGEADLVSILLAAVPVTWKNQYSLTYSTVPESACTLLVDLENIERFMMECYNKKQKLKDKASTARLGRDKPKKGASGGCSSD